MRTERLFGLWMTLVLTAGIACAQPFTYQGFLKDSGTPANGIYDFRFRLWTAPSGGTQIGPELYVDDVSVQNGLFTVQLDFGAVWDGSDRYLEILVRLNDSFGYWLLAPRVKITPTPYAAYAQRPWQTVGSNIFYTSGNVGIGTSSPSVRLSLGGDNATTKLAIWDGGSSGVMGFGIAPNQFRIHLHNPNNRFSFLDAPSGTEIVTILGNGNVGIGTNTPNFPLSFGNTTGDKIALWGQSGAHYGFGIQDRLLQIYTDNAIGNIAFGYGSSANFTEVMRIEGTGNIGIGTSYPEERLHVAGNLRLDGEIRTLGQIVLRPDMDNVGNDFGVRIGPRQANVPSSIPVGLSINMRDMTGIPLYLATGGIPAAGLGTITAINHGYGRAGFFESNEQTCVTITSGGGSYVGDWPSGWRGGLTTWDICASGVYASEFRTRSDERLKRDIQPLDASSELQRLLNLRPVSYYWRDERLSQERQYGFIAQELREVFPELVQESIDDQKTLSVNYQALIPLLVNALQQQEARIQRLEAELQRLRVAPSNESNNR